MRVMGLDMSTATGMAVVNASGMVIHAQQVTFPKQRGMERINSLVGTILAQREVHKPELVVIEDYATGAMKGAGAFVSAEIQGVLRFILWQEGITYFTVPPSMLKKFLTGSGLAKKEHMMLEVFKRWNYSAATNDIADAVALAHIGLAMMGHGVNCTKAMLVKAQEALALNT